MKETYGMQLDIYAWDAGNLDGAGGGYETPDSEKLRAQYPNGYEPIVKAAAEMGTRMGVWGGADGYGDTEEEANARRDILVKLCKDYHFALFKFDTVCGELRAEKRKEFEKSMRECLLRLWMEMRMVATKTILQYCTKENILDFYKAKL